MNIFVKTFHLEGLPNCFFNPGAGVTIGSEVVGDGVLFINDRHPRAAPTSLLLQLYERTRSYKDCIRLATFASESSSTAA